jgi:transcriptional regulator GlxA family with amidase domain
MHRVAVVAVPTVTAFELSVPDLLFGQTPGYEVLVCAAEPGPVPAVGGVDVVVRHGLDVVDGAATVLVIGGASLEPPGPAVVAALRRAADRGARLVALSCAGAFQLAAAGLLDGRPATTGASMAAELRRRFPAVEVRDGALFVDGGGVFTCAGHAAAIDLCLALIRADHGASVAAAVARGLAAAPVRPGAARQRLADPLPPERALSLAGTREWALDRLHRPLTLADLAGHASTSVRTLTRRFTAETGTSPQRWLLARRLERACELLEATDLPVDVVARRSGLGSADSLRAHLRRELGSTPSAYRNTHRTRS